MKCPKMYKVIQQTYIRSARKEDEQVCGENHILVELQSFNECYKEECVAWDKDKQICKYFNN